MHISFYSISFDHVACYFYCENIVFKKTVLLSTGLLMPCFSRELAEIDQRIARIRMGAIDKKDISVSRSSGSSETIPTGPKAAQLTPRDTVTVEGRAASEASDNGSTGQPCGMVILLIHIFCLLHLRMFFSCGCMLFSNN